MTQNVASGLSPAVATALGIDAEPLEAPPLLLWPAEGQCFWGGQMARGGRDVDVYVRKLRFKLEQAAPAWVFIHTHRQFGYRFAPERR